MNVSDEKQHVLGTIYFRDNQTEKGMFSQGFYCKRASMSIPILKTLFIPAGQLLLHVRKVHLDHRVLTCMRVCVSPLGASSIRVTFAHGVELEPTKSVWK